MFKKNEAQELAVNTINGPVIVVSCPGSGKTTTLIRRIHNIIESGAAPESILMVTFSNSAADDMRARYAQMYGSNPGVRFMTIHSLCYNILRISAGYTRKDAVITGNDAFSFILDRIKNIPDISDPATTAREILEDISYMKNTDSNMLSFKPKSCEKKTFEYIYRVYEKEKLDLGKLDYDDMLVRCRALLRDNPDVLKKYRKMFRYIQCDEYQDTNKVQRDILYMLAGKSANICVVGDDDQSIYRFRGADSSIMMGFTDDFREKSPKKIMMSTNYRSAGKIVEMADSCIKFNRVRFEKKFISERGRNGENGSVEYKSGIKPQVQITDIVQRIRKAHEKGVPYKDMAILFRINRQAAMPVQALSAEKIPFNSTEKVKSLYDGWMFEDIRAYVYLSMGRNTEDNLIKIINRPNRYLKASAFVGVPFTTDGMLSAIDYLDREAGWRKTSAEKSLLKLMNCFGPGKITLDSSPEKLFRKLMDGPEGIGYDKYIKSTARFTQKDPQDLMDEFATLEADAMKFDSIGGWFAHAEKIKRIVSENNKKNDKEGVVISTMHKSKGLEWKYVFIISVNDGNIPSREAVTDSDLEEERRLLYVAMTRAKDNLVIYNTGPESPFMIQTMNALQLRSAPAVRKKLAGSPVRHRGYGDGVIKGYTRNKVIIIFDEVGEKQFKFPDAFVQGYLEYI